MRKLFIQFYLLLFVCFLVMTLLVGLVYKVTAERAGRKSMDDLMKSSLYLMRNELRTIPPRDWNKTINKLDLNLSFKLHIESLKKYQLNAHNDLRLRRGEIVALDDEYTFIQRIPRSNYVLAVGPIPYLFFIHEMRLLDLALLVFIGLSLAFPVFIWMRPHWQDMLRLETAAQRLGAGFLEERIHFDNASSLFRLGVAFNQMADNVNTLIASKKQLIDNIAHELRTPLVRLRYRLAMSEGLSTGEQERLNRDVSQLEGLIDELLTFARLDRPQVTLNLATVDLPGWLTEKLSDIRQVHPERIIGQEIEAAGGFGQVDARLMERVLDNLVNNALRYSREAVIVRLGADKGYGYLQVDDDGPGIPEDERQRVFEPFVRLDPSRDRTTGGCGLGLAIVRSIALAHEGRVTVGTSPLGGASFLYRWPINSGSRDALAIKSPF
ncbi:two-component system sensor histidine kinase RstB [Acerihabitans arboris]|uniref:histidine kinase n=1 Tax=Acerihabitans arboris TaxID=2691583 RepID=A0A845SBY4_9GAMM|nr:two-component system sensor histidine kinase RstB [Acerihabitans arboris]NDL62353.1 two-component system sensor histidine kinase RstB [Acerihabitans arboris]